MADPEGTGVPFSVAKIPKHFLNPYPAKLPHLNVQPLEVVSRYRDPQPQVAENY